jgi:hypothetical protein
LNPDPDTDPYPAFKVNPDPVLDPDTDPEFLRPKIGKRLTFFSFFDQKLQFSYP